MTHLHLKNSPLWLLLVLLAVGCSETRNLAEDETLYVGIKKIDYEGRRQLDVDTSQTQGVITALGNAYNAVSDLLSGDGSALAQLQDKQTEKQRKDSLKALRKQDGAAYDNAKAEVEGVLEKAPNNSLMGSSYYRFPLPIGLWIYNNNVYRDSRYGRWMMNTFAATPVYITTVNPRVRVNVAQNTLRNFGYFRAEVDYATIAQSNPKKAKITYYVRPGELFRLDTIAYQMFPPQADSLIQSSMENSLLRQGEPFNVQNLDGERTRLNNLFRDNGYFYYQSSYVTFRADTIMRPLHVQLQVRPSQTLPPKANKQYYLGKTRVNVYNYEDRKLNDSITFRDLTFAHSGKPRRPPLKFRAMRRYMHYRKGELYNQTRMTSVQNDLSNMGVFSQLNMDFVERDSTLTNDTLDIVVTARLDKPWDSEFQGNVSNKSNGLLGPGVSFSMSRINAFRGAETVSLDLYGSYEWMTGAQSHGNSQVINSYEYGADLELQFPRLTLLGLFPRLNRGAKTSTSYKLSADWMNRSGYYGQVQFGARISYSYQRRPTIKHELTLLRLDYNKLFHTTDKFSEIMDQNPTIYVSMRDQLVPSMQYTLDLSSRSGARNSHSFTFDIKEAGNLTSAVYQLAGEDWKKTNKKLLGLPFSQYVRLTAQWTGNFKLGSTNTYLASRLYAGTVISYGNATSAPYSDLFSVGGANSIRAFSVRSIGPGSYKPESSKYSYIDQVGDLKLEANLEYRFPLIGSLNGAMFLDAGNVWLLKPDESRPGASFNPKTFADEIALGTGFGFRYDLEFLVIRFDIGIGLHAPYDTGKSGYYNMTKFWDSLGYHIAVGYPF